MSYILEYVKQIFTKMASIQSTGVHPEILTEINET